MKCEAETSGSARVRVLNAYKSVTPSFWECGGFFIHAVSVTAKGLVERRELANAAVDQFRQIRVAVDEHIGFPGKEQSLRALGQRAEDRLARDAACSSDNVLKLVPIHD